MLTPDQFWLKVSRFETTCRFELTWDKSNCITSFHAYPPELELLYQDWQQAYLSYYQTWHPPQNHAQALRAHLQTSGSIDPKIDWRTQLKETEMLLLQAFQGWLAEAALRAIRQALAEAARRSETGLELYLTCESADLVRLPWEQWQISEDPTTLAKIQLVRTPSSIRSDAVPSPDRWRRIRILAICCDDIGLNLSQEKQILKSLEPLVSVEILGWGSSPLERASDLRQQIFTRITDPAGWDMLFFAGHSDETKATSGKLAIAPNAYITIAELKPYLTIANHQGLQLAIFNSCSGLQIAKALIDLGVNEVIVMRERIHSEVAQQFLVQFAAGLRAYKTADVALREAVALLRQSDYPSAYLVPSLFRRPGVASFALTPPSWRQAVGWLLPKRRQALALLACLCLCLWPGFQIGLLDQREWVQAEYRQLTHQIPNWGDDLALVRIDDASIQQDKQNQQIMHGMAFPVSQQYIGELIKVLAAQNVGVIGIDYVMDDPDPRGAEHTIFLSETIQQATQNGSQFVFAKVLNPNSSIWMQSLPEITQGNLAAPAIRAIGDDFHMPLQSNFDASLGLPFSYWLSWLHRAQAAEAPAPHWPQINRLPLSELLDAWVGQLSLYPMWFHAITDFSMPPEQIYREIPAWKLLEPAASLSADWPKLPSSAIITAGGYPEAGIAQTDNGIGYLENFTPPKAMQHWYGRQPETRYRQMTGGEHLAYLFSQFLHQRFVIPVPNLLMVLLAAAVAKLALTLFPAKSRYRRSDPFVDQASILCLSAGTILYSLLSLQLYISAAILLPIFLPLTLLWLYLLPELLSLDRTR